MDEHKLPLGIIKQAVMKLDSFSIDMSEIIEDEDITQDDKEKFQTLRSTAGDMMALLINIVREEIGEEEFINEQIDLDEIDPYPEEPTDDLLNDEI